MCTSQNYTTNMQLFYNYFATTEAIPARILLLRYDYITTAIHLYYDCDQGCHTRRPEAFWRANRAGGQAALYIMPYMNRAGYCRR
jgi:hypothetical protein